MTTHEPRALLTIPQVARLLHVSEDTVRRQIREGDLEAVRIGTTPTGRPRYRVPAVVVEARLGRSTLQPPSAAERLHEAFAELTEDQQAQLLAQAVAWARRESKDLSTEGRRPEPTREEVARRFPGLAGRRAG
ncbi:helix-turn-helix domain-containing protein [Deinococcus sp. MIMF12]|uniref:Helix-turn-helix domain-containing protein n=1 Tax=Deinococcus rhizophilus TaxID=3049544 RepID=A0ABT7JGK6_9DEIO|nr:helix-turn-helix domain-containing protein [Deinococcus rhizophilus]MDL2343623.1 helix-turn-helix domain-containing protein [Deinococcus rhizophilus]